MTPRVSKSSVHPPECAVRGGTYQGNGTLCEPTPCPTSSVAGGHAGAPFQAIPNPAPGSVVLLLTTLETCPVRISIVDAGGRKVRELLAGKTTAGRSSITWDGLGDSGQALPSGVYFAKVEVGGKVESVGVVRAR